MLPLLFLSHRIPYPPNKGDKVRSFHLLKSLSSHYDIYLGAFVDDQEDWQYKTKLEQYCKEVHLLPLRPMFAKIRSLKAFISGEALSIPYYYDSAMCRWVERVKNENNILHALIYSSPMAQYINESSMNFECRVADFVDIDSDKWNQYGDAQSFPLNKIYKREAHKLLLYEKNIAKLFDATLFVSETEKIDFDKYAPESINKHGFYNNGVDYSYFDPDVDLSNPYSDSSNIIVFTGAMDYWANVDAVTWFSEQILPGIVREKPNTKFFIVGSNPAKQVRSLECSKNIFVTGRVDDIRPYVKYANLAVAPMRIARGIQNKVLEAMAMAKPVVATSLALEGISLCEDYQPYQADNADDFTKLCLKVLGLRDSFETPESRACIKKKYDWEKNLQAVMKLLQTNR